MYQKEDLDKGQISRPSTEARTDVGVFAGRKSHAQTPADAPANITEAPAVTPSPAAKPAPAKRATAKRHTPADKRYAQLQTQLTEQQKKK